MDTETALLIFYIVPLAFNLVYSITTEWKSLHTVGDFLFPLDGEENILIWFPVVNAVYTGLVVVIWIIDAVGWFLGLKIKK